MTINMNSKSSLIIAGSAAAAGAVIFGITKLVDVAKSKKTKKESPAEAEQEEKPMKAVEESEDK